MFHFSLELRRVYFSSSGELVAKEFKFFNEKIMYSHCSIPMYNQISRTISNKTTHCFFGLFYYIFFIFKIKWSNEVYLYIREHFAMRTNATWIITLYFQSFCKYQGNLAIHHINITSSLLLVRSPIQ